MSTLHEHLENAYEIDIDQELELRMLPDDHPELQETQRFIVNDEDKATWALRKLARIEAEDAAVNAQYDRETARLNDWFMSAREPLQRQREFFLGLLREYHQQCLAEDPSKKTIKLPAGTLKSKAGQNRWTVDADAFLEWFDNDAEIQKEHPDLVRVKRDAALSAIKQILEPKDDRAVYPNTGEIVPGVSVEPGQRTFTVEVAE